MVLNRERLIRLVTVAIMLATLSACSMMSGRKSAEYGEQMGRAEGALSNDKVDVALVSFANAAKADPTRKEPWVRIAQIQFDRNNYAHAIVAAEEALQRDARDLIAEGILTLSGLRIASQSLQRLGERDALGSETARREARALADTLKTAIGEEPVVDDEEDNRSARASRPAPRPKPRVSAPPKPKTTVSKHSANDPFSGIGGD
tara:strand:+ start:3403 stop:4014 length:612 start_codon:yes stop_codon:yes gene_type:complete